MEPKIIEPNITRRKLLANTATLTANPLAPSVAVPQDLSEVQRKEIDMTAATSVTFKKTAPPHWLLAFWREIEDKTWGEGFTYFTENAVANHSVGKRHKQEAKREKQHSLVDIGFSAHDEVVEFWDGGWV